MKKSQPIIFVVCFLAIFMVSASLTDTANAEAQSDELLNVSIRVNEQQKNLPLRIEGPQPIFVEVGRDELNSFVESSVYLDTEVNKKITISSDLKNFIATVDGAKTVEGKNGVTFVAQKERVQLFAYGNVPDKSLFTILRVVGDSDLLNVLARINVQQESQTVIQQKPQDAQQASTSNPLDQPVMKKLDAVIANSTLPNTDHYRLAQQDLEKMITEGKQEQAVSQALLIIDEIHEKEGLFAQNKRECERSRLKIIEVEDLLTKSDIPKEVLGDAKKELDHAKSYQNSFLCAEALVSAGKAESTVQLDPLSWLLMTYPWVVPTAILVPGGFVAIVMVQRHREQAVLGGLR